jgi:hypothetical protein
MSEGGSCQYDMVGPSRGRPGGILARSSTVVIAAIAENIRMKYLKASTEIE